MRCVPILVFAASSSIVLASCAHPGEVVNLDAYRLTPSHGPLQRVAVLPFAGTPEAEPLFAHVTAALRSHPSVRELRTDWRWERPDADFVPDVVLSIEPTPGFSGSLWNYLITFPGFLLFTPAWHGYVYSGDITTTVRVHDPKTHDVVRSDAIETAYSMRHCDFGRAFWAEIGWWTPGYGAASAFTGLYMITYDADATAPFHANIRAPYGEYIAERSLGPVIAVARGRADSIDARVLGAVD